MRPELDAPGPAHERLRLLRGRGLRVRQPRLRIRVRQRWRGSAWPFNRWACIRSGCRGRLIPVHCVGCSHHPTRPPNPRSPGVASTGCSSVRARFVPKDSTSARKISRPGRSCLSRFEVHVSEGRWHVDRTLPRYGLHRLACARAAAPQACASKVRPPCDLDLETVPGRPADTGSLGGRPAASEDPVAVGRIVDVPPRGRPSPTEAYRRRRSRCCERRRCPLRTRGGTSARTTRRAGRPRRLAPAGPPEEPRRASGLRLAGERRHRSTGRQSTSSELHDQGRAPASASTTVKACFRARLAGEPSLGRGTNDPGRTSSSRSPPGSRTTTSCPSAIPMGPAARGGGRSRRRSLSRLRLHDGRRGCSHAGRRDPGLRRLSSRCWARCSLRST